MVLRYVTPENFKMFEQAAKEMGYLHAACAPMAILRMNRRNSGGLISLVR